MHFLLRSIATLVLIISAFALPLLSSTSIQESNDLAPLSVLQFPAQVIATQSKFSESVKEDTESIPFKTRYVDDSEIELGEEVVVSRGSSGAKRIIVTDIYYDGEEYSQLVEEEVVVEPIEQVVARGTKIVHRQLETEHGRLIYIRKFSNIWATSYDSTCLGCSTTTATGMKQGYGVVAVDPDVILLGSKLYIPGYGIAVAGDVGGSVKGDRIDLGYDSLNGQWQAHYVDVYLLVD